METFLKLPADFFGFVYKVLSSTTFYTSSPKNGADLCPDLQMRRKRRWLNVRVHFVYYLVFFFVLHECKSEQQQLFLLYSAPN